MEFEFKAYNPNITGKSRELAAQYGYKPYMIERYFSMLGQEETLEFLQANETFSPLSIRVNQLKSDPESVKNALTSKGYAINQVDTIPYAYSIPQKAVKNNPRYRKLKSKEYQSQGYDRDSKTLKQLQWGKPSYLEDERKSVSKQNKENKLIQTQRGKSMGTLGSTHEYLMGNYYIQDIASMYPVLFLNPQPSDLVVDMCAAPGGKTTHLAQLMENQGHIFAIELDKKRIKSLIYNLRRCGVRNTTVLNMNANSIHKQNFNPDKILLDAPCTGEGLIRNDPTRKMSKSLTEITGMMRKQTSLLQSAIKTVKPGGHIMYSTCSIAPEENEFIIQKALDSSSSIEIMSIDDDWGLPGYINVFGMDLSEELLKARRLFPHIHNTIGFFYCLLKKTN